MTEPNDDVSSAPTPAPTPEARDKARAEADSAAADAAKKKAENAEWGSESARAAREAERRKTIAEADSAAADAQRKRVASMLPDLSTVEGGSLSVSGDAALFGSALAHRALRKAAMQVAAAIETAIGGYNNATFLVTSDPDLVGSDSVYAEVDTGLDELLSAADRLLEEQQQVDVALGGVEAGLAALAGAIPSVLDLLSARRTVSSYAITLDDVAATAAVCGAMKDGEAGYKILHDDFRLAPAKSLLRDKVVTLRERRRALVARKFELEHLRSTEEQEVTRHRDRVLDLEKQPTAPQDQLTEARQQRDLAQRKLGRAVMLLGLVDSLLTTIDAFTAALTAARPGSERSPLAGAILREGLHAPPVPADQDQGAPTGDPQTGEPARKVDTLPLRAPIRFVVLVKGASGSSQQLVNDRPLWFEDKFATVSTVSLTYLLIATSDSYVVKGGTVTGTATIRGQIGDRFVVDVVE